MSHPVVINLEALEFVQRPGIHRPLRLRPGVDFTPMDFEQPEALT